MEQPVEDRIGRTSRGLFAWIREWRVVRTPDRWIGGTAAGFAHRLGIDPALVRAAFLLAALVGGLGLIVYGLGWLFLPDSDGHIAAQEALHGRPTLPVATGLAMVILGMIRPITWVRSFYNPPVYGPDLVAYAWAWILILLAFLLTVAVVQGRRSRRRRRAFAEFSGPVDAPSAMAMAHATTAPPTFGTPLATAAPPVYQAPVAQRPARTPRAPRPARKPRTPGPGTRLALGSLAAALLVASLVLVVARPVTIGTLLAALGSGLAALGVGILVAGIRGWRGGWLTALSVLGVIALIPGLIGAWILPRGMVAETPVDRIRSEYVPFANNSITSLDILAGEIHLQSAASSAQRTEDLDARLGLGSMGLAIPSDQPAEIVVHIGSGWMYADLGDGWEVTVDGEPVELPERPAGQWGDYYTYVTDGFDRTMVLRSPAALAGEDPVSVNLEIGAGTITMTDQ